MTGVYLLGIAFCCLIGGRYGWATLLVLLALVTGVGV